MRDCDCGAKEDPEKLKEVEIADVMKEIIAEREPMQQERFDELEQAIKEKWKNEAFPHPQASTVASEKGPMVELSADLSTLRIFIDEAISRVVAGGKSRPRSLAITKLQEASFWLNEEMRLA